MIYKCQHTLILHLNFASKPYAANYNHCCDQLEIRWNSSFTPSKSECKSNIANK